KAARSHLAVTKEIVFGIRKAAVLTEIFGRHIERISQHLTAVADQRRAARKRNKHPFVRIEGDRVRQLDPTKFVPVLIRKCERTTVSRVGMKPATMLASYRCQL